MNRRFVACISALALGCACGPSGPRDAGPATPPDAPVDGAPWRDGPPSEEPTIELATGQSMVEPLAASDPQIELIYGAQGGYHVWGRARFRNLAPDVDVWFEALELPSLRALHTPLPGRRWIEGGLRRGLLVEAGGFATEAELVVLDIRCTAEVLGRPLRLTAHVRERATGRSFSATRDVRVVDELPSPACVPGAGG